MTEPEEHERVLEMLRRARRPESEITPEHREENLRWLIRMTLSEAEPSDALRGRVRALVAARPAPPPSRLSRLRAALIRWRGLAGAAALAAACLLLSLFLATRVRAQMLARTLAAMALVRTAHCTGWRADYRTEDADQSSTVRTAVEWWYKAPDCYREEIGRATPGSSLRAARLVVNGGRNAWMDGASLPTGRSVAIPGPMLHHYLSALDFFDQQGLLHRAQTQKAGEVGEREGLYRGRSVRLVDVTLEEKRANEDGRSRWRLYVDPASDRVLRSETRFEQRGPDGAWTTLEEEVLDQFEYDVPVSDRLFDIPSSSPPVSSRRT